MQDRATALGRFDLTIKLTIVIVCQNRVNHVVRSFFLSLYQ